MEPAPSPAAAAAPVAPASVPFVAPRGVGTARRTWKEVQTKRSSAATRPGAVPAKKGVRSASFTASLAQKRARAEAKEISRRLKEELAFDKEAKRARRLENLARRAEGLMRGTQFTQITDARTIKKMNKRQLRNVQKTVVDKHGNTRLVPLYGAGGGALKHRRG
jgi:hypothetical protein